MNSFLDKLQCHNAITSRHMKDFLVKVKAVLQNTDFLTNTELSLWAVTDI